MNTILSAPPIASLQRPRALLQLLVTVGGGAALSWEVIWQLKTALAVGISALGTAITLSATMGGLTVGALLLGRWLRQNSPRHPVRLYGGLEFIIGLSGLLLGPAFSGLESLDAVVYGHAPSLAPLLHLVGIGVILGPPTVAMGATVPLFGLAARQYRTSIALLYGLNTLGAAGGALVIAFVVLPALGVERSIFLIAGANFLIAVVLWFLPAGEAAPEIEDAAPAAPLADRFALVIVFMTGFATFGLEVAWFRALRAAYLSMTSTFAILLAAVLLPLALAARKVADLQTTRIRPALLLAGGGAAVLLATPVIERFDVVSRYYAFFILPSWFVEALLVLGPPMFLIGMVLPWLLDRQQDARAWGRLYAVNCCGAIAGALLSAWVLLPSLGFARTAWLIGLLIAATALLLGNARERACTVGLGLVGLMVAMLAESGVGRSRVIGAGPPSNYQLIDFRETPDSTVSVIETSGRRVLYIDGFAASDETAAADYMIWMGRLPMLLHPDPQDALVICFGTGQTANAVRQEGPARLDLVDLSQSVFDLAPEFKTNQGVLNDPRVTAVTMDGRAWLRRTQRQYDVLTLEPMPPTFAGVNALYSREFYESARGRLRPGGIVAQWLPFHLVNVEQAAAIAATFCAAFPGAILWIDPLDSTGILLGRKGDGPPLEKAWPGLDRSAMERPLPAPALRAAVALNAAGLERFAASGTTITDDNQLLAYSWLSHPTLTQGPALSAANHARVQQAARGEVPGR